MYNFVTVTNTHSSCADLWEAYFCQLEKYLPGCKHYVFSDEFDPMWNPSGDLPKMDLQWIKYGPKDKFSVQYRKCLEQVEEDVILYLNEDYWLYGEPDIHGLNWWAESMAESDAISFIRLAKGVDAYSLPTSVKGLWHLDSRNEYFFSQTASLWKREHLLAIHRCTQPSDIAGSDMGQQFEVLATETCRKIGITGMYWHDGEPKRGMYHHDTKVFPYIATAIIKGNWCTEYPVELPPLLEEYGIDPEIRGWA